MSQLHDHIGPALDVPTGDINAGAREISFLFGADRRITRDLEGVLADNGVILAPGKAENAGGVAISGLEISQNALRRSHARDQIDDDLQSIMAHIHDVCADAADDRETTIDYAKAADIAGVSKVASAMVAQGF